MRVEPLGVEAVSLDSLGPQRGLFFDALARFLAPGTDVLWPVERLSALLSTLLSALLSILLSALLSILLSILLSALLSAFLFALSVFLSTPLLLATHLATLVTMIVCASLPLWLELGFEGER